MANQSKNLNSVTTMKGGQTLRVGQRIGAGGEQSVLSTPDAPGIALGIPNQVTAETEDRLRLLQVWTVAVSLLKHFAWPLDLLTDQSGKIVGYTMRRVQGELLSTYLSPTTRPASVTLLWMLLVFKQLAECVHAAHASGFRIGDLNCNNVMVQPNGQVVVLDVPSFYVAYQQRIFSTGSGVGAYLPPELQNAFDNGDLANQPRTTHGDSWSFGVLLFKGLFEGFHPFSNREMVDVETVVKSGQWPYDVSAPKYHPKTASPPLTDLPPTFVALFSRCFVVGMKDPIQRPLMAEWFTALEAWIADEEQFSKTSSAKRKASATKYALTQNAGMATPLALLLVVLLAGWLLIATPGKPSWEKKETGKETPKLWKDLRNVPITQGELQ